VEPRRLPQAPLTSAGLCGPGTPLAPPSSPRPSAPMDFRRARPGGRIARSDRSTMSGSSTARRGLEVSGGARRPGKASTTLPLAGCDRRRETESDPCTRAAVRGLAKLPCPRLASVQRWARSLRRAAQTCRAARRRAARRGASVSSTTSSARPTESASSASCSGFAPSSRLKNRLGHELAQGLLALRLARNAACRGTPARRSSSAIRPGFSTPLVPARLSRSQAS